MNHVVAIIGKFIMVAAILIIINSFIFGGTVTNSLVISLVVTVVTYIAGDMFIFPKSGNRKEYVRRNTIATFSDGILAFVLIYFVGALLNDYFNTDLLGSAIASALVIGIGEWIFHRYLDLNVFYNRNDRPTLNKGHLSD
ncbi:DUF2512 family protein [Rummeliibacillus pycnus]|uniref:DUF2512 family protein n=1 Tax=Rummeliibacillus pycnus TaxID=101070 RepID=UPI000C9A52C5|nr:DUF2512 family protein [Rummeliibacillus pycnus]